ncbi:hypothetical protein [Verrucomicrobium spinosum]|uniref:hypothetical protein n=1 Tax=Verrucomicrobium spinosum TaxID=2736 RepID=UPI0001744E91|nr:hypothetical protein [Verrucomicrobium spinosum]
MANTSDYEQKIEPWFRGGFVSERHPGAEILKESVRLKWGGFFEADAVVRENGKIVAVYCLSCAEYLTHGGNPGAGKFNKIRADVLMLSGIETPVRCLVFTGRTMYDRVLKERSKGRLPQDILLAHLTLPQELSTLVSSASARAVAEVTPGFVFLQPFTDFDPATGIVTFEMPVDPESSK